MTKQTQKKVKAWAIFNGDMTFHSAWKDKSAADLFAGIGGYETKALERKGEDQRGGRKAGRFRARGFAGRL